MVGVQRTHDPVEGVTLAIVEQRQVLLDVLAQVAGVESQERAEGAVAALAGASGRLGQPELLQRVALLVPPHVLLQLEQGGVLVWLPVLVVLRARRACWGSGEVGFDAGVRAPGERTVLGGPCVGYGQAAKLSRCFSHRALASATSHMQSSMAKKRRRWGAVAQTATSEMAWSQCRSSWSRPRSKQACTTRERRARARSGTLCGEAVGRRTCLNDGQTLPSTVRTSSKDVGPLTWWRRMRR